MIDLSGLGKLFTIVLGMDGRGHVQYASETFRKHMPGFETGCALLEVCELVRPATVGDWTDVDSHINSLFLLTSRGGQFAIRGQLLKLEAPGEFTHVFCGSPWLTWINDNSPQVRLGISDFSPQDSQLDQLFMMTTEKRMVSDLERLNADLKQAKRQAELAEDAKAALFARMSHEMRTPLNGVISALSLLIDNRLDPESQEILRLAQSSSQNLLHVINYVLDVARIEASDESLEAEVFHVDELLQGVADIVRARAVEKGIALRCVPHGELSENFVGDVVKIRQCLLNLTTNAIKFTSTGTVSIRALPVKDADTHNRVRFEVEDTGIGISAADRGRIFEPFWTGAHNADAGTGLGLDIVRRTVERMGGSVGVVSAPGEGALFWIDLPLERSEPLSVDVPAAGELPRRSWAVEGSVLLVDDNRTNLILGRKILEGMGVTVDIAQSGSEAIERCHATRYDLVLMDISMPAMDGVEATRHLRQDFSESALPIVALTAYANSDEEKRCRSAGMNHYLTKPIVREKLAEQLRRFLTPVASPPDNEATTEVADNDTPATLNSQTLAMLYKQVGNQTMQAVIDEFNDETAMRRRQFSEALDGGDADTVQREAHSLGSTCLSLGLDAAGAKFREVETALRKGGKLDSIKEMPCLSLLEQGLTALKCAAAEAINPGENG